MQMCSSAAQIQDCTVDTLLFYGQMFVHVWTFSAIQTDVACFWTLCFNRCVKGLNFCHVFCESPHEFWFNSFVSLRSSISHVRESGGGLISSISYLCSGLLGGGWTVSTLREEVGTFPSYCLDAASGPWHWSSAPPCLKKHGCTSGAVVGRFLARLDGWRREKEAFNQFSAPWASKTFPRKQIHSCDCHSLLAQPTYTLTHRICNHFPENL